MTRNLCVAMAMVMGLMVAATAEAATPAAGEKAPELELKTLEGEVVKLSQEVKERPVVLVVLRGWPGYQCPLCTRQVADLRGQAAELEKAGARVVLVYPGPGENLKEHAEEFVAGKGLPESWRFVVDPDYKFTNAWGLRWETKGETAYPSTFVVDREQVVRYAHVSTSHGDRVKAKTVLGVLQKLK